MTTDITTYDLLSLVSTPLRKIASTRGGEYHGPCPKCGGKDRFVVQPIGGGDGRGQWMCRSCHPGWGDAIVLIEWLDGVDFWEACRRLDFQLPSVTLPPDLKPPEPVNPPSDAWQARAMTVLDDAVDSLYSADGTRALAWLQARGFNDDTLGYGTLGYNPADRWEAPELWGLPSDHKKVYLPRGVVIPWFVQGGIWKMNIRRPISKAQAQAGEQKYIQPAGGSNALYNVGAIRPGQPIAIVEGELDALAIHQAAGDLAVPVATGSAAGARRARWYGALACASVVLVAFDSDPAGDDAARYWLDILLGYSLRWRPILKDAGEMLEQDAGLREWVQFGVEEGIQQTA